MPSRAQRLAVEHVKRAASLPFRAEASRLHDLAQRDVPAYQLEHFRKQYKHAISHVPYYMDNPSYPPALLEGATDLQTALRALPVLRKETVRSNRQLFLSRQRAPRWDHTTGGTTGTPMKVSAGLYERGWTEAILGERYRRLIGTRTPRTLRLSGYLDGTTSDELWQMVPGTGVAYLSIYQLTQLRRTEIVEALRRFGPQLVHGYASALVQLARLVTREDLPEIADAIFVSTSETLYEDQRAYLESRLGSRVLNEYGSQEGQHLVLECLERCMHVHPRRGIVELLDDSSEAPAQDGTYGRVVVTGLIARQMPLLRYDLGDSALVRQSASACPCGSGWPAIGAVSGRTEDLVRLRDGRRIGLLGHSTLKDLDGVREAQIVQTGFETFTYRMVLDAGAEVDHVERHIVASLRQRLGVEAHVTFDYVDTIPRARSGKLRAVVVAFDDD